MSDRTSAISLGDAEIDLSVVVAVWPDLNGTAECLRSLASQQESAIEVLLVGGEAFPIEMRSRFPSVRWFEGSPKMLVPHLWSIGIAASRGNIIALTTARFMPARDWLKNIYEAHRRLPSAGIGGAIDPPPEEDAKSWAIYFLRYSAYLSYSREQLIDEIAGENASYKRDSLTAHGAAIANGFWEPEFHRLLRAEGKTLTFVPAIRITQGASLGFRDFCQQRFRHGRHFGRTRLRESSAPVRIARIVTSPLIPAVLLAKIFYRVIASRRYAGQLLVSLPILLVFVVAWTIGEVFGYCTAGSDKMLVQNWQKSPE